jgi:dTDP-4-dehydrorhamnose reductase
MRIVVTGAGGQLGHDVVEVFRDHDVFACDHAALDVADRDAVLGTILTVEPDVVVHTAAWTAVDACESDPGRAFAVNALGTRHVAEACRRSGAHLVHISTDYVFDGTAPDAYREWDEPRPLSVYGRSKLAGEREVDHGSTIIRTAWVCGANGTNFIKTMLRFIGERDSWSVVNDQRGCPTFTSDLAVAVRRVAIERRPGLFHVTNQGTTTWYGLAREVLQLAGTDPDRIHPISSADYAAPAPRPANSVLENAAWKAAGLPLLTDYHDPLERLVKELLA